MPAFPAECASDSRPRSDAVTRRPAAGRPGLGPGGRRAAAPQGLSCHRVRAKHCDTTAALRGAQTPIRARKRGSTGGGQNGLKGARRAESSGAAWVPCARRFATRIIAPV